jgi:LmbE family N-acetylglucosaminyl deacetylase
MATVVAFHAHPDDEVLLTGGTLARLAAEGHRVVIAVATDGIMGPATGPGIWSGTRDRLAELRASAAQLGAARVVHLGYADSGHGRCCFPTRRTARVSSAPTRARRPRNSLP